MTLQTVFLWLYSAMASLVFGATVYEALVVHPAWSRKPPESFVAFMGTPVGRMNLAAFWIPVAPLFALSALASAAVAAMQGTPNLILIASAACAVTAVAWTLTYFRPKVVRFLEQQGGQCSRRAPSGGGAAVDRAQLDPGRADYSLVVRSARRVPLA